MAHIWVDLINPMKFSLRFYTCDWMASSCSFSVMSTACPYWLESLSGLAACMVSGLSQQAEVLCSTHPCYRWLSSLHPKSEPSAWWLKLVLSMTPSPRLKWIKILEISRYIIETICISGCKIIKTNYQWWCKITFVIVVWKDVLVVFCAVQNSRRTSSLYRLYDQRDTSPKQIHVVSPM
jgi:hypothetical protein